MKKSRNPNWGGSRPGAGKKPHCGICKEEVTKEQLAEGDAHRFTNGIYYHHKCAFEELSSPYSKCS